MLQYSHEEIAHSLIQNIKESCQGYAALCRQLMLLLADGQPVSRAQLARAMRWSLAEVESALKAIAKIEYNAKGDIIGAVLSLEPTPHHISIRGHALYTWCALDTLFYPVVLQERAYVESACPVTHELVRLSVTPEKLEQLEPAGAYISLVLPEAAAVRCDIRGNLCNHIYFFSSKQAASTWQVAHPDIVILPIEEAYAIGQRVAREVYALPDQA
ncbi:organomercurial lyase MerB [Ktedonosporobacter rubrisoli]|uniref:Alkylmercury lyase n=1 Tax=Ktedonosporobacter rubrisoli TaxID=2509675 RepID=A0A4V0YZT8_KTERU|nr:organomercurial lyase MerB [Ktedonosporobacter rubrisoli]QBD80871.1 organomercurial lyase MerB [Ktedonosporobacter rubrisoli]